VEHHPSDRSARTVTSRSPRPRDATLPLNPQERIDYLDPDTFRLIITTKGMMAA